jgi:hypothetical protein
LLLDFLCDELHRNKAAPIVHVKFIYAVHKLAHCVFARYRRELEPLVNAATKVLACFFRNSANALSTMGSTSSRVSSRKLGTGMSAKPAAVQLVRDKRERRTQEIGYNARPFVLCGLLLRQPPKDQLIYTRRNGNFLLEITAHPRFGLPYGQDQLIPIWLATLAIRQKSPTLRFDSPLDFYIWITWKGWTVNGRPMFRSLAPTASPTSWVPNTIRLRGSSGTRSSTGLATSSSFGHNVLLPFPMTGSSWSSARPESQLRSSRRTTAKLEPHD